MNRLPKILLAVALAPVALVGGCYAVTGVAGTLQVAKAKRQAVTDIDTALPAIDTEARRQQTRLRALLLDHGRPAYSWRELDCGISSIDGGWIVQDYEQSCEVRTVDLYPVPGARRGGCHDVPDPQAADGSYRTRITRGRTAAIDAPLAAHTFCPQALTGTPSAGASRLIGGAPPTDLTASPAWLVAESHTPVSRTPLGCNPWGVMFCGQPVSRPVLAAS